MKSRKLLLLRYDVEGESSEDMKGFLRALTDVHRADAIPVSLFCMGGAMDAWRDEFRSFAHAVAGDALFDLQNHSHSHIGLGYPRGRTVEALREDYERSFAVHEELFGSRPIGISICGTSQDGPRLGGFDETAKSRAELDMVASLGVRMINAFLRGVDEARSFTSFAPLGHAEIMGFPSAYGDTAWMLRKEYGDPMAYILREISERSARGEHLPLMLHDWVAWNHAPDRNLTHVRQIAAAARKVGYEMVTHAACLREPALWT